MSQARVASHAQGLLDGRAEGRIEANQRTDDLANPIPTNMIIHHSNPLQEIERNTKETADTLKQIKDK
jgi:hypothetical protein